MHLVHPELLPGDPPSRERMREIQDEVRGLARFTGGGWGADSVVVGVDQAFGDDTVVSAAVATRGEAVLERSVASVPARFPYVPGFLTFREAPAVAAALSDLEVDPDVLLIDGNGRVHPREAGIATHVGVAFDAPAVGIAKRLLCGSLDTPPDPPFPEGTRVPIRADERVDLPDGTVIGYAVQTRQWDRPNRHVNPVYVSPGHRVDAERAATLAEACCAGYKLPEPIRLADRLAGERASEER